MRLLSSKHLAKDAYNYSFLLVASTISTLISGGAVTSSNPPVSNEVLINTNSLFSIAVSVIACIMTLGGLATQLLPGAQAAISNAVGLSVKSPISA